MDGCLGLFHDVKSRGKGINLLLKKLLLPRFGKVVNSGRGGGHKQGCELPKDVRWGNKKGD